MMGEAQRQSTLTCPHCARAETLKMPLDACVVAHVCVSCGARLTPRKGDCCVFCSYGDVPCPPVQGSADCCGGPMDEGG
ncbi:MAG: hypothetical protein FJX45_17940 [Alphaproteobacteria bacterium]|nr:hypothetical protein [Alphaproteobacteria bacterium]MBM3655082.1 hypothetical protein [Alphaproteobacteria bacterium]